MTIDSASALAAVNAVLSDVGLDRMTAEHEFRSNGRRPSTSGLRLFGRLIDNTPVTAKILPAAWPFDLDEALRIQRRYASGALPAFAAPDILAQGRVDGWHVVVEQLVVGGCSLADLVLSGEIDPLAAGAILSQAIRAAQSLPVIGEARCARERAEIFAILERAPIPRRHHTRISHWLDANYLLVSHPPVDSQGDYNPANLLRVPGDDRWWLVDFDLAAPTSLLWQDHLRISRLTGWTLPDWDDTWGHPDSLATAFLSRLLEWDLQVTIRADGQGAGEHALALGLTAERWADQLGPPSRQTPSPRNPLPNPSLAGIQVFWPIDGQIREEYSSRGNWPADGERHLVEIDAPTPVSGRLRLDPADGPCAILLHGVELRDQTGSWHVIPLHSLVAGSDLILLNAGDLGCWCLCQGDPQLFFDSPSGQQVTAIRIDATKHHGLDPALADALVSTTGVAPERCAALVQADISREQQIQAQLRADVAELQWRLGAAQAAADAPPTPTPIDPEHVVQAQIARLHDRIAHQEADLLAALTAARTAGEAWATRVVGLQADRQREQEAEQALAAEHLLRETAEKAAQTALVNLAAAEANIHSLKERFADAQAMCHQQNLRLATLETERSAAETRCADWQQRMAEADRQRAQQQESLDAALTELKHLQLQHQEHENSLLAWKDQHAQAVAALQTLRLEHEKTTRRLDDQLHIQEELVEARNLCLEYRVRLETLQTETARLTALHSTLLDRVQAGEQAKVILARLRRSWIVRLTQRD